MMAPSGLFRRVRTIDVLCLGLELDESPIVLLETFQRVLVQVFATDEPIAGTRLRCQELVQLEVNGNAVLVLSMLNQEDHQEGDDRRAGVDDELPRFRKPEPWTADGPTEDDGGSKGERPRRAARPRCGDRRGIEQRRPSTWTFLHAGALREPCQRFCPPPQGRLSQPRRVGYPPEHTPETWRGVRRPRGIVPRMCARTTPRRRRAPQESAFRPARKPRARLARHLQRVPILMTLPSKAPAQTSPAPQPAGTFDDRCDFILFLQRRLRVNRRQARTLLSAWMQEFTPTERAARAGARGRG